MNQYVLYMKKITQKEQKYIDTIGADAIKNAEIAHFRLMSVVDNAIYDALVDLSKTYSTGQFDLLIKYANEFDKKICATFKENFPQTKLETRSITKTDSNDIPHCIGIIGQAPT